MRLQQENLPQIEQRDSLNDGKRFMENFKIKVQLYHFALSVAVGMKVGSHKKA